MVCRADDSATLVAMLPLHCRCISIPTGSFDSPYRLVFAWFGPPIAIFNFARLAACSKLKLQLLR